MKKLCFLSIMALGLMLISCEKANVETNLSTANAATPENLPAANNDYSNGESGFDPFEDEEVVVTFTPFDGHWMTLSTVVDNPESNEQREVDFIFYNLKCGIVDKGKPSCSGFDYTIVMHCDFDYTEDNITFNELDQMTEFSMEDGEWRKPQSETFAYQWVGKDTLILTKQYTEGDRCPLSFTKFTFDPGYDSSNVQITLLREK